MNIVNNERALMNQSTHSNEPINTVSIWIIYNEQHNTAKERIYTEDSFIYVFSQVFKFFSFLAKYLIPQLFLKYLCLTLDI